MIFIHSSLNRSLHIYPTCIRLVVQFQYTFSDRLTIHLPFIRASLVKSSSTTPLILRKQFQIHILCFHDFLSHHLFLFQYDSSFTITLTFAASNNIHLSTFFTTFVKMHLSLRPTLSLLP